jgi:hypothetical protein
LVSHKKDESEVLVIIGIFKIFMMFFVNLADPTSFELLLINGKVDWNVKICFTESDVFLCTEPNKFSVWTICNWILDTRSDDSMLDTPLVEYYILFLLLYFLSDFPIRRQKSIIVSERKTIRDFLRESVYYVLPLLGAQFR